jgi:hypothetical protein
MDGLRGGRCCRFCAEGVSEGNGDRDVGKGKGGLTSVWTDEKERLLPATTEVVMGPIQAP